MRRLVLFLCFVSLTACSDSDKNKCDDARDTYSSASSAVDRSCTTAEDCVWGRWDSCGCPEPANQDNDFTAIRELRDAAEETCDGGAFCANNISCPHTADTVAPNHPPVCERGRCAVSELATATATMEPSEIASSDAGMTDEFFTVTVTLTGDYGAVDTAASRVYIHQPETVAVPTSLTETSDGIWVFEIPYAWLAGLNAGTYRVDVEMVTEYESLFDYRFVELVITP